MPKRSQLGLVHDLVVDGPHGRVRDDAAFATRRWRFSGSVAEPAVEVLRSAGLNGNQRGNKMVRLIWWFIYVYMVSLWFIGIGYIYIYNIYNI